MNNFTSTCKDVLLNGSVIRHRTIRLGWYIRMLSELRFRPESFVFPFRI